ncbi:MAG: hypothetical protein AAF936_12150 [Pseudomonadota bacterium]
MLKNYFAILFALVIVACSSSGSLDAINEREFETKVISRGDNFPPFRFGDVHAGKVLVLVKEGVAESEIREHKFADGVEGAPTLDALIQHGFLIRDDSGSLQPRAAVMTIAEVSKHMPVDAGIVEKTKEAILSYAPHAFEVVAALDGFSHLHREQYDLFLLSNGLLDNFQIGNVEAQVIESERPERAGGNYYLSIQEKDPASPYEAFGIYGNNTGSYGNYILGVYGNQRNSQTNFHRMREKLYPDETPIDDEVLRDRRNELVQALGNVWADEAVSEENLQTLAALGYVTRGGVLATPVLTTANYSAFSAVVNEFTPILVGILREHAQDLRNVYAASPYANEISFEEYFMWWFHLYYSAVTDALVEEGEIHIPAQGVSTYLMIP